MGPLPPVLLAAGALLLAPERPTSNVPTRQDIAFALTSQRYDDSCEDPLANEGCPMINLHRVQVRDQQCRATRRAERAGIPGEYRVAVMCRFQSAVTVGDTMVSEGWRDDQAMLFLLEPPGCPADSKTVPCRPRWSASPRW